MNYEYSNGGVAIVRSVRDEVEARDLFISQFLSWESECEDQLRKELLSVVRREGIGSVLEVRDDISPEARKSLAHLHWLSNRWSVWQSARVLLYFGVLRLVLRIDGEEQPFLGPALADWFGNYVVAIGDLEPELRALEVETINPSPRYL